MAWWSALKSSWTFGDLTPPLSGYRQGEATPFLARWGASAGQTFRVSLVYDCATSAGPALDFVSGAQSAGDSPAATAPGPGRPRPDAAIPLPDDPSITADDGNPGLLELWGGKFTRLAQGPTPAKACPGKKSIDLDLEAAGGTVYLLGSAHLARGAAAQASAYGLEVIVTSVGAQRVAIAPGAVAP